MPQLASRLLYITLVVVGSLGLICNSASQAQLVPLRESFVSACLESSSPSTCEFRYSNLDPVSIDLSLASATGGNLVTKALAESSFGVLRCGVSESFNIPNAEAFAFADCQADFRDVVTVDFAPFRGDTGLMLVTYRLSGTILNTGQARTFAWLLSSVYGLNFSNFQDGSTLIPASTSGYFSLPRPFKFTYGQPFAFFSGLQTSSGTIVPTSPDSDFGYDIVRLTGQGSGSANFSNTLEIVALEIFDSNGGPLPFPPTITSASGTQYSESGVLQSFARLSMPRVRVHEDRFKTAGSFKLGENSNGIDPLTEDVGVQIGDFSAVIPAGSFKVEPKRHRRDHRERLRFEGVINDQPLALVIEPLDGKKCKTSPKSSRFLFAVLGRGVTNLANAASPITARLSVGDDGGTTKSKVRFEQR